MSKRDRRPPTGAPDNASPASTHDHSEATRRRVARSQSSSDDDGQELFSAAVAPQGTTADAAGDEPSAAAPAVDDEGSDDIIVNEEFLSALYSHMGARGALDAEDDDDDDDEDEDGAYLGYPREDEDEDEDEEEDDDDDAAEGEEDDEEGGANEGMDRGRIAAYLYRAFLQQLRGLPSRWNEEDDDDDAHAAAAPVPTRGSRTRRQADEAEPTVTGSVPDNSVAARWAARNFNSASETRHEFEKQQQAAISDTEFGVSVLAASSPSGNPAPKRGYDVLKHRALGCSAEVGRGMARRDIAYMGSKFLPNTAVDWLMSRAGRIYSGQFSASGDYFVGASQDRYINIYETTNGFRLLKSVAAQDVSWTITSTDMSQNEEFLIYSTISSVIRLCNVRGEFELHDELHIGAHSSDHSGVWCSKFAPGGNELAAGTSACQLVIYDIERKRAAERVDGAHEDDINTVEYLDRKHRPNLLATGSDDTFIKIWDRRVLGAGRPAMILAGHSEGLTCVSGKGDGVYLVSNAKDQTAKLWDLRKATTTAAPARARFRWDYRWMSYPGLERPHKHPKDASVMTYRGHQVLNTLIRVYFSPAETTGQRFIYTGSADGRVYIYDALTGVVEQVLTVSPGRGAPPDEAVVRDVSWHPKLPVLCAASWGGVICAFDHVPGMAANNFERLTLPTPCAPSRAGGRPLPLPAGRALGSFGRARRG